MKRTFKKISIILLLGIFCVGADFFVAQFFLGSARQSVPREESVELTKPSGKDFPNNSEQKNAGDISSDKKASSQSDDPAVGNTEKLVQQLKVPFIVQAPFGNWSDPIFQNACEESSVVMAMGWLKNIQSITPENAQSQILEIVKYEDSTFGYNADTDVFDIRKILTEYFGVKGVEIEENVSLDDMIGELRQGNLLLVPAFGQVLGNPNYTPPGPIAHMLVVTGYDDKSKKFIVNDPGTRHGADYKYDQSVLFDAIWQYPSGKGPLDPPQKGKLKKTMIVVPKK